MRKDIFGIAATMLLVGTMALTSCSEDSTFGYDYEYDEEWDDLVPRTKQSIGTSSEPSWLNNIPDTKNYIEIAEHECSVASIASMKGQLIDKKKVEVSHYHAIVATLKLQEEGSAALTIPSPTATPIEPPINLKSSAATILVMPPISP